MIPTWQTVAAPNFGEASRMIQAAQQNMGAGFDTLNGLLKKQEDLDAANAAVIKNNNTQAFLDQITKFQNTKDFQAAQGSGVFDQMQKQFGDNYDRVAVRAALDGRLAALQGRDLQGEQYKDGMQKAVEAPLMRQALVASLNKDTAGFNKVVAENPNAMFLPEVLAKNRDLQHQDVTWQQDATASKDAHLAAGSKLQVDKAQIGHLGATAKAALINANANAASTSEEKTNLKLQLAATKAQQNAAELLIKNSPLDAGTMDTYAGQQAFEKALGDLGLHPAQANAVRQEYTKRFGNGVLVGYKDPTKPKTKDNEVRIGLPVSTALAGVKGTEDDWLRANWLGNSYRGANAVDKVLKLMDEPNYVDSLQQALQAQGLQYSPLRSGSDSSTAVSDLKSFLPRGRGELSAAGVGALTQVIEARANKVKEGMTPEEIKAAANGKLSPRIKKMLEVENER